MTAGAAAQAAEAQKHAADDEKCSELVRMGLCASCC